MHGRRALPAQTPVVADVTEITIEISGYDFAPRDLTVQAGATVTWLARDDVAHDATESGRAWTTGTLRKGETGTITFESAGRYDYFCTIHPAMRGRLVVQ